MIMGWPTGSLLKANDSKNINLVTKLGHVCERKTLQKTPKKAFRAFKIFPSRTDPIPYGEHTTLTCIPAWLHR